MSDKTNYGKIIAITLSVITAATAIAFVVYRLIRNLITFCTVYDDPDEVEDCVDFDEIEEEPAVEDSLDTPLQDEDQATEDVAEVAITLTAEDAELWNNATRVDVLALSYSGTPWGIHLARNKTDGTVETKNISGSVSGYRTCLLDFLCWPGQSAASVIVGIPDDNKSSTKSTRRYLLDDTTASVSFVMKTESGAVIPARSIFRVLIQGVN